MSCSGLKIIKSLFISFLCVSATISSTESGSLPLEVRQKTLEQIDSWINKITPFSLRSFPTSNLKPVYIYKESIPTLQRFSKNYNFFSKILPLVGAVTEDVADIKLVEQALESLLASNNQSFIALATGEILSKSMAYRNLEKGMTVHIPVILDKTATLVVYTVDEVLDLWEEMPAFGLIPQDKRAHPLLLFRGTDFSLLSKKSWASIVSDLDISGTGFSTFHLARSDIHNWLEHALAQSGSKAQVMGFSLGGVLSIYTAIFEKDLIASEGSMSFNPPGVTRAIDEKWKGASSSLKIYVSQGDLVSKIGILPLPSFLLFTEKRPLPIQAHTQLMTGQPLFFLGEIPSYIPQVTN